MHDYANWHAKQITYTQRQKDGLPCTYPARVHVARRHGDNYCNDAHLMPPPHIPPHTSNTSFNSVSQVTVAAQDAALFDVYFAHFASIPCGVFTWLPPSLHTPTMFISLQQHVTGHWERGRATPQLRLRTSTVLVFRLRSLMVIFEVLLLQTRLRLDIMRHIQVTVVLLAYVCGTQSNVHQEINVTKVYYLSR